MARQDIHVRIRKEENVTIFAREQAKDILKNAQVDLELESQLLAWTV